MLTPEVDGADRIAARARATVPVPAPAGSDANGAQSAAPLVLVAEDNEISRAVARALLAQHGVQTHVACDGLEAVQMASEHGYAAVLMDCEMPALDGYAATARIRAAERDGHVPIIAMTAHAMPGDRERCLAAGMDDYLCKPVQADELAAVIERWISPCAHENEAAPDRRVA
jgi:CheY-like chemotaxis protein